MVHQAPKASALRCLNAAFDLSATMPGLLSLHLDVFGCSEAATRHIFHSLRSHPHLQTKLRGLSLVDSSSRDTEAVAGLRAAPQLRTLDLRRFRVHHRIQTTPSYDPPGSERQIAAAVQHLTHLESLSIEAAHFVPCTDGAPPPVASLLHTVEHLAHLTTLHLCGPLSHGQIEGLAAQPTAYTGLRRLCLASCLMPDVAAGALAAWLSTLPALSSLDLSANHLDADGIMTLVPVLASLEHLEELDLAFNRFGRTRVAAVALADALARPAAGRRLRKLNLNFTEIENDGARRLAPALAALPELEAVQLSDNLFLSLIHI